MAISMSGATVKTDERESLLSSKVDASVTKGGETLNTSGLFGLGGASGATLAGITKSFASNVSKEIDSYCDEVNASIEKLSTVEVNQAFQGGDITVALNNFIESVKTVAKSYTLKLKAAETEIINSVAEAYSTQDSDISGNLGSDASSLEETSVE